MNEYQCHHTCWDSNSDKGHQHGCYRKIVVTYTSSRLTKGNLLFPDTLVILPDSIPFTRARLLGRTDRYVNFRHISSVRVNSGVLFASVRINSPDGSGAIVMRGLGKENARAIKDSIETIQRDFSREG